MGVRQRALRSFPDVTRIDAILESSAQSTWLRSEEHDPTGTVGRGKKRVSESKLENNRYAGNA